MQTHSTNTTNSTTQRNSLDSTGAWKASCGQASSTLPVPEDALASETRRDRTTATPPDRPSCGLRRRSSQHREPRRPRRYAARRNTFPHPHPGGDTGSCAAAPRAGLSRRKLPSYVLGIRKSLPVFDDFGSQARVCPLKRCSADDCLILVSDRFGVRATSDPQNMT